MGLDAPRPGTNRLWCRNCTDGNAGPRAKPGNADQSSKVRGERVQQSAAEMAAAIIDIFDRPKGTGCSLREIESNSGLLFEIGFEHFAFVPGVISRNDYYDQQFQHSLAPERPARFHVGGGTSETTPTATATHGAVEHPLHGKRL